LRNVSRIWGKKIYRGLTENVLFIYFKRTRLSNNLLYTIVRLYRRASMWFIRIYTLYVYIMYNMVHLRSGGRVENFRVQRKEASQKVFLHIYYKLLYVYRKRGEKKRGNDVGMINIRLQ